MKKVIIAGGRDYNDYHKISDTCDKILTYDQIQIVSGKCSGVDYLGEKYAIENGYSIKEFPANWNKYKKAAGPIRNKEMAEYADILIAFYNGKSKGTKNMITLAKKNNLEIYIILVDY